MDSASFKSSVGPISGTLVAAPTGDEVILNPCSVRPNADNYPVTLLYGTGGAISHLQPGDRVTFWGITIGSVLQADWARYNPLNIYRLKSFAWSIRWLSRPPP